MALNGDDEFEWEPPTEAEMKVLAAQRERQDKISKLMGDYLLKGYKMLGDCCQQCATILLEDRQKNIYCVACQELDSDVDKDNPALNAQAALSQVRERQLASQPSSSLLSNGEVRSSSSAPRPMRSLPRPEHCEGAASGLRTPAGATGPGASASSSSSSASASASAAPNPPTPRPSAAPLDPPSGSPVGGVAPPLRPPGVPPSGGALQQALGEAEEALLAKLQWASCQLDQTASVEASVQLCQLIHSCATSLRSIRDLQRD